MPYACKTYFKNNYNNIVWIAAIIVSAALSLSGGQANLENNFFMTLFITSNYIYKINNIIRYRYSCALYMT